MQTGLVITVVTENDEGKQAASVVGENKTCKPPLENLFAP